MKADLLTDTREQKSLNPCAPVIISGGKARVPRHTTNDERWAREPTRSGLEASYLPLTPGFLLSWGPLMERALRPKNAPSFRIVWVFGGPF